MQIALARFAMFTILLGGLAITMAEPCSSRKGCTAFALANPDVISIEQVRRYTNVEISGDALYVVHYNLEYTVPPSESITQGWIGRLLDVGGAGQLGSVAPQTGGVQPDLGYTHGAYSFYFGVAPVPTGTLTITLEGNPGLSPTPTGITTTSIEDRAVSDLPGDMRILALHFETTWSPTVDLITFAGGVGRFTDDGSNYFLAAVPNLNNYAPTLFSLGFIQPDPAAHVDTVDPTFQTARDNFWSGTPLRGFTATWGGYIGLPRVVFETILVLITAVILGGMVYKRTDQQELGIFTAILWINVAAFMGLGPLALPYTLAFAAVFILAYLIFFRPSSA